MKRKWTVALAAALITVATCAVALAAAGRAGMLDFISRYSNSYIPEDAAAYVQTDVATVEQEGVVVSVRESYYDGRTLRLTVDITPRNEKMLLVGVDSCVDDSWQDMITMDHTGMDAGDTRAVLDAYHQGGYDQMFRTNVFTEEAEQGRGGGSLDFVLDPEDGTMTYYLEQQFEENKPEREVVLHVSLTPYDDPEAGEESLNENKRVTATQRMTLTAATLAAGGQAADGIVANTYVSVGPVDYESIGVRVDRVLIEVMPQEIYYTIDGTVTDRELYEKTDDGLFFEFIDPNSTAEAYWEQRLMEGLSAGSGMSPLDGDLDTAVHYQQTGTLGRNELHDAYTLRAYECWEKQRFDTHEIVMRPATQADVEPLVTVNEAGGSGGLYAAPASQAGVTIESFRGQVKNLPVLDESQIQNAAQDIAQESRADAGECAMYLMEAAYDGQNFVALVRLDMQQEKTLVVPRENDSSETCLYPPTTTSAQVATGDPADAGMTIEQYARANGYDQIAGVSLFGIYNKDFFIPTMIESYDLAASQKIVDGEVYALFMLHFDDVQQTRAIQMEAESILWKDGQYPPKWKYAGLDFEITAKGGKFELQ